MAPASKFTVREIPATARKRPMKTRKLKNADCELDFFFILGCPPIVPGKFRRCQQLSLRTLHMISNALRVAIISRRLCSKFRSSESLSSAARVLQEIRQLCEKRLRKPGIEIVGSE